MKKPPVIISAHVTMLGRNHTRHFPTMTEALGFLRTQESNNANAVTAMRIEVRLDKDRKDRSEMTWASAFDEALLV